MTLRALDNWELVWIIRGRATLTGRPCLELPVGHLLLLPPQHPHGFDWNPRGITEHGYVHFDLEAVPGAPDVLGRAERARGLPDVGGPVQIAMDEPLSALCAYLQWLGSSQLDDWQGPVAVTIGQILQHMIALPRPADPTRDALPVPVMDAVQHLRHVWVSPPLRRVSLAELSAVAVVSPAHLNRLFNATFELSVATALEQVRCLRAATLLERTDMSTAEIARQCGFADASHFSHRFREITGSPPRAVRDLRAPINLRDKSGLRRLETLVLGP
jgi:AraC-like DNA-binding protein